MFAYLRHWSTRSGLASSLLVLAIQLATIPALANHTPPSQSAAKFTSWLQLGAYAFDRQRGEGALWVPLFQDHDEVFFTELKGKLFEDDAREGNVALGYRAKAGTEWSLGVWTGYDLRRSDLGQTFHQIAGGFEALSHDFDFRANWYVPINRSETVLRDNTTSAVATTSSTADFDGNGVSVFSTTTTIVTSDGRVVKEHALFGADAEFGLRVPLEQMLGSGDDGASFWHQNELRLYAGGYYFNSPDVDKPIAGPRLRLEWRINDVIPFVRGSRLTFEAAYQYDDLRSSQYEAGLRLRLPFGVNGLGNPTYARLTNQERRMSDSLQRDTDVVAKAETSHSRTSSTRVAHSRERAVDVATGVRFDRVVRVNARSDLNETLAGAGGNSLVIADGRRGAFVDQNVTMQADQTLMGGGSTITVRSERTGRTATFHARGRRATIRQTTNDAALTVNSNTHVTGIELVGGGDGAGTNNRGITTAGQGYENIRIDHVQIRNTDGHAVRFDSVINDWSLRHATITGVTHGNGIDIEDRNHNFEISNVEFSDISMRSGDAIHISGTNSGVISNNHFNDGISDFLIRVKSENVITGTGNVNNGGNEIYQYFGGNNELDITFEAD